DLADFSGKLRGAALYHRTLTAQPCGIFHEGDLIFSSLHPVGSDGFSAVLLRSARVGATRAYEPAALRTPFVVFDVRNPVTLASCEPSLFAFVVERCRGSLQQHRIDSLERVDVDDGVQ